MVFTLSGNTFLSSFFIFDVSCVPCFPAYGKISCNILQFSWEYDFKLLGNNYQSNIKRKISESLFIRQLKPSLNKQDTLNFNPLNLCNRFLIAINTCINFFDFKF